MPSKTTSKTLQHRGFRHAPPHNHMRGIKHLRLRAGHHTACARQDPAGCPSRHGGARQEAPRPGRLILWVGALSSAPVLSLLIPAALPNLQLQKAINRKDNHQSKDENDRIKQVKKTMILFWCKIVPNASLLVSHLSPFSRLGLLHLLLTAKSLVIRNLIIEYFPWLLGRLSLKNRPQLRLALSFGCFLARG